MWCSWWLWQQEYTYKCTGSSPFWDYYLKQNILRCKPTALAVCAKRSRAGVFFYDDLSPLLTLLCWAGWWDWENWNAALCGDILPLQKRDHWTSVVHFEMGHRHPGSWSSPVMTYILTYQVEASRAEFLEEERAWIVGLLWNMAFLQEDKLLCMFLMSWSYQSLWGFNWC